MRKHVNEVDHHHIKVVLHQIAETFEQLVGTDRIVDLVVRERIVATEPLYLLLQQRLLVDVLALVLVLVNPQFGEHLLYLLRHKTGEDGVACVLCGCRQDTHIHVFLNVKHVADFLCQ